MSKKIIKVIIITVFILVVALIIGKQVTSKDHKFAEYIPSGTLINNDFSSFILDSIHSKATIMVFYSSDCMFCKHEANDLSKNNDQFKDYNTLFINMQCIDSSLVHCKRYGLDSIPYFHSLTDTTFGSIINLFGIRTIPTTLIYNKEKMLIKGFEGEVNAKLLLKTIKSNITND